MQRVKTFEEFLIDFHAQGYVGTDDDMVEDFEDWIQDLDLDDMLKLADCYGSSRHNDGYKEAVSDTNKLWERITKQ